MIKTILSVFLIINLVIFLGCEAPTPTKPTPTQNNSNNKTTETNKETPEKIADNKDTKPTNNKDPLEQSSKNSSPTPTPATSSVDEKTPSPQNSPTPEPVNNKNNKNSKDNNKQTPQPTPSKTPEPTKNNKDNKQTPQPTKTPEPVKTPEPIKKPVEPVNNVDQATSVYRAIDIVLGRKAAGNDEKANAVKTVKSTLAIKGIQNARNKRNDPNLLKDRYPKTTQLKVGTKNQTVFWTAYDRIHFAARHLMDYFDTQDVKGKNSWWPAGTTMEQIDQYLQMTVENFNKQIYLPDPAKTGSDFKYFDFDLQLPNKSRFRVSVGITSEGRITSFFPKTGNNVISLSETELQKLLNAVGK